MGAALKRIKDKTYRLIYDIPNKEGKRKQKCETLYNVTKAEAEATLAKRKAQAKLGESLRDPNLTIRELFAEFMEAKRRTVAVSTYELYESYLKVHIDPALGGMKLATLRQGHLLDAYAKWSERGARGKPLSGRSVRHVHELIRNALSFALRREYVTRNVATLIASEDLPKAIKPEPVALDETEALILLEAARHPTEWAKRCGGLSAEPWFGAAVAFAVYTGSRCGETLAVRWSDCDLKQGSVTIRHSLARTRSRGLFLKSPKNGKARTIALPSPLVAILKQHRENQNRERTFLGAGYKDADIVFARPDGSFVNPQSFGARVIDLAERAKVKPITLHCLRDTHASLLAKKGVPLEVVSKRLGHSAIGVTAERYLHCYPERDAAAARVLDTLSA